MIGETILQYKIIEKLGEACLHLSSGRQGGPVLRSLNYLMELTNDR